MPTAAELMALGEYLGVGRKSKALAKPQPRQTLDQSGLAALVQKERRWPSTAKEVGEVRSGYPMAPLAVDGDRTDLWDRSFIGPMEPPMQWNLPIHMRRSILEGMMD